MGGAVPADLKTNRFVRRPMAPEDVKERSGTGEASGPWRLVRSQVRLAPRRPIGVVDLEAAEVGGVPIAVSPEPDLIPPVQIRGAKTLRTFPGRQPLLPEGEEVVRRTGGLLHLSRRYDSALLKPEGRSAQAATSARAVRPPPTDLPCTNHSS